MNPSLENTKKFIREQRLTLSRKQRKMVSLINQLTKNNSSFMKKILALDLGDQWVGIAISDISCTFARPHSTAKAHELKKHLTQLFHEQEISTVVVGNPKTMKGTESEQTKKTHATFEQLKEEFPSIAWTLWDERLTSSWAGKLSKNTSPEEKLKSHARAAAFILDSYLTFLKNSAAREE